MANSSAQGLLGRVMAALILSVPPFRRAPDPATISAEAKTTAAEEDLLENRPINGWGDITHVTCNVCLEVLYRPVAAWPCLHTFCGHCMGNVCRIARKRICPECRAHMMDSRPDHKTQTLIDSFLKENPASEHSPEERKQFDAMYPPGGSIFACFQQISAIGNPANAQFALAPRQSQIIGLVRGTGNILRQATQNSEVELYGLIPAEPSHAATQHTPPLVTTAAQANEMLQLHSAHPVIPPPEGLWVEGLDRQVREDIAIGLTEPTQGFGLFSRNEITARSSVYRRVGRTAYLARYGINGRQGFVPL